jgi:hypothetical protein
VALEFSISDIFGLLKLKFGISSGGGVGVDQFSILLSGRRICLAPSPRKFLAYFKILREIVALNLEASLYKGVVYTRRYTYKDRLLPAAMLQTE